LTIWVTLFKSYLQCNNLLEEHQQKALEAILRPYIKIVDATIIHLKNKTNAVAKRRDVAINRQIHPTVFAIEKFEEAWKAFLESLREVISLPSSECFYNKDLAFYYLNEVDTQSKNMGLHKDAYPLQQEELSGIDKTKESLNSQKNITEKRKEGWHSRYQNLFNIIINSFNFFKI
jgi:hypothetical protein